jgi:outer membrane protein assembly factor BamB
MSTYYTIIFSALSFFSVVNAQCGCTKGFPPTTTDYSVISGDAGCVLNYLEMFDAAGASIYSSGNVSSRVAPFEITCPGSSIASFSFVCNDGPNYPLSGYAVLTTLSSVMCTNGNPASIVGLNNVCGTTVGTIGADPRAGTCTKCTPGVCPVTPPCTSQTCVLGPSPLSAPWPMMGQDPAHRSTSQYNGPQTKPLVAWSEGGGAYDGVTIGNDGTVYSSVSAVKLLSAYSGETGQIKWTTLNSGNGSNTYTIGPGFTLLGNYQASYVGVLSQLNGALQTPWEEAPPTSDITYGTDGSASFASLSAQYFCARKSIYGSPNCIPVPFPVTTGVVSANNQGYSYLSASAALIKYQLTPLAAVWTYNPSPSRGSLSSPAVSIDNVYIFVGTSAGYALSVVASSGSQHWETSPCPQACTVNIRALPVPSKDKTKVFFPMSRVGPSGFAGVVALSVSTGATRWKFSTSGDVRSIAQDAGGLLFIGDSSGSIYGVRSSTGAMVWTTPISGAVANLAIGANSFLYAATNTSLVALH